MKRNEFTSNFNCDGKIQHEASKTQTDYKRSVIMICDIILWKLFSDVSNSINDIPKGIKDNNKTSNDITNMVYHISNDKLPCQKLRLDIFDIHFQRKRMVTNILRYNITLFANILRTDELIYLHIVFFHEWPWIY